MAGAHRAPSDRPVRSLEAAVWTRPDNGSRMKREFHVRFCERPKGRFLWPTRPHRQVRNTLAHGKYILLKYEKIAKIASTHLCNSCGVCCRNFAYIRLSQDDIKTIEAFTGQTSEEFIYNTDEKCFMKFQENGDCIFLNMIAGVYSCSVYEARSLTCRDYPSTDIQRETCRVNSGR